MPSDPVEAGRKGGKSRSVAKLAAARRNGFQPRKVAVEPAPQTAPLVTAPGPVVATQPAQAT